jgi:hypothetical protein
MFQKSFRNIVVAAVLSLPIVSLTVQSAKAEDLEFTLNNKTKSNLVEFYVESSDKSSWGENLLKGEIVRTGESGKVTIADGKTTCTYDILGVFADGSQVDERQLNLCELGAYTYTEK